MNAEAWVLRRQPMAVVRALIFYQPLPVLAVPRNRVVTLGQSPEDTVAVSASLILAAGHLPRTDICPTE